MRRVICHPDGRVETAEGTPEEIAAYDNLRDPPVVRILPSPTPLTPVTPYPWPQLDPGWPWPTVTYTDTTISHTNKTDQDAR